MMNSNKGWIGELAPETKERTSVQKQAASVEGGSGKRRVTTDWSESDAKMNRQGHARLRVSYTRVSASGTFDLESSGVSLGETD